MQLTFVRNASVALALVAAFPLSARSEQVAALAPPASAVAAPQCTYAPDSLSASLGRITAKLTRGERLTVVAFGSSSTWGIGATTPANNYPARLEALLRARFPGAELRVLNRGVNGENTEDMLARLHRDVLAHKPDLVLWQVGTNDVLGNTPVSGAARLIRKGVARMKAAGAEVLLIDPQYAPAVVGKPAAERMVDLLATIAREHGVGVFHRFALMRGWHVSANLPFSAFVTADGLHMNDWGYDCIARQIAGAIGDAAPALGMIARR